MKLLCFDCHLYVFIVISNTSGCLVLSIRDCNAAGSVGSNVQGPVIYRVIPEEIYIYIYINWLVILSVIVIKKVYNCIILNVYRNLQIRKLS
jgi:hypothetical protein